MLGDLLRRFFGFDPYTRLPAYLPGSELQPFVRRGVPGGPIEIVIPRDGTAEVVLVRGDAAEDMACQIIQWRAADRRRER
jgi:hypothetical protein